MKMKTTLKINGIGYDSVVRSLLIAFMLMGFLLLGGNAFGQIALRNTQVGTTTSTTLTINKPTGLVVGDVMIANVLQSGNDNSNHNDATSSGWTFIAGSNMVPSGNNRYRGTILYKIATAADVSAANFQFALDSGSDDGEGGISAFSGVDIAGGVNELGAAGGPFDVDPGNAYTGLSNDNTLTASAITTSTANAAVILIGIIADNTNAGTFATTSPGTLTELYDEDFNASLDMGIASAWAIKSTAGSTGSGTANLGATANNGALLIALRRFNGTISTGTVTGPICAGSNISVPYTITGSYATGNVFTAQLSNAAGSFASPTVIGTATATAAGSISAAIPAGQAAGTGYRIRVISDFPPATGSDNGVNLSIVAPAAAAAGSAFSACATAVSIPITTGASATNNAGVLWTSNGTGTIANDTSISTATYTPGLGEVGPVTFTLTATGNTPCGNATSNKILTLVQPPTAAAGGSTIICSNQTAVVSGASSSNGTIAWTENGAGSITAGGTTLTPTYTAAAGDAGNAVTLTMTVSNASCSSAIATYTVNVVGAATAVAGTPLAICTNDTAMSITAGASASNNTDVAWTHNGTGSIANANSLTLATYTPGIGEVGDVTLTLTATGNTPCGNATSNKTLTINNIPVTTGVVICAGQSGSLTSSTVCPDGSPQTASEFPASGTNSGAGTAWTAPGNILGNDNSNASVSGQGNAFAQTLNAGDFGFSLPANASIGGIQVTMGRFRSGGIFGEIQDNSVRLLKAGIAVGTNKAATSTNWPTSEAAANYGATNDLWGTTWTAAEVNASNFGVALIVDNTSGFSSRTANVDYISVTVTYTVPGDMNWYTVSSGGSPIGTGSSFNPVGVAGSGLADTNTPGTTTYYAECSTVAGCRTPTTFTINALPTVSFTGLAASYCGTTAAIPLTGNHAPSGTFTGAGITDNGDGTATFNPAAAGAGLHAIVYSYTDGNTCVNTDSQNVTVIAPTTYYADVDGDGFGNLNSTELSCTGPSAGFVADNTDCNDNEIQYLDADGDGFGSTTQVACGVSNNTDCDDAVLHYVDLDNDGFGSDTFVNCGGVLNTDDCDDTVLNYADLDGDGFGSTTFVNCGGVLNNTDCDDAVLNYTDVDGDGFGSDTFVNCGGVLNTDDCDDNLLLYTDVDGDGFGSDTFVNCGGVANTLDCNDNEIQYLDADNDGFGSMTQVACGVTNNTDCDDNDITKNTTFPFYVDADGDTYGTGDLVSVCAVDAVTPPANYSLNNTDCNDGDIAIFQSASLFVDADNDGYNNGTSEVVCYGASVPSGYVAVDNGLDCNDAVFAINPGHAEVLYNGIDDNCDGNLDEGFQYTTSVIASQCATTLSTINSFIIVTSKAHVTMHRFEVTNMVDMSVQYLERTQNYFSPVMLPSNNYATTYSIRCEIQRDGIWLGYYGPSCLVSTPAVLVPGGAATISPSQCGGVLPTISTLIATTSLANVTGYKFRVTNASDPFAPNQVQVIDRAQFNWFALTMLATYTYGTTYFVEVSIKTNGVYSPFGSPCAVTSPAAPMLTNCGATIATKGTLVSTASLDRVTSYRFKITNFLNSQVTTLDRTQNWFTFNNVPGFTPGGEYGVEIAVMTSGVFSPFGEGCSIFAPAAARTNAEKPAFDAVAYPNPFADSFGISLTTSMEDNVNVKVYDMTGRLLESTDATILDMQTLQVGGRYPSGVYNIVVSQGAEVETLRVIKR